MPTVNLKKSVVEKLIGKKLSLEELKDRISMIGTDLEKVEGDEIIVEVFPNRPDMLSEPGFARALSAFLGVETGLKKYNVKKSGHKIIVDKSVTMRAYSACAIVKNVEFTDERIREIMQLQEKLGTTHGRNRKKSCYGLYPLTEIEFPITYIAKEPEKIKFKPLGFEVEMTGKEVEEKHPTGQKFKYMTEGWKKYPCYVDAKGSILSMIPYTNSNDTGRITVETRDVFIECTGTDLENLRVALNIFVTTLSEMGGDIYSLDIHYPDEVITTPDLSPKEMKLDLEYINKLTGLELSRKELQKWFERMGHTLKGNTVLIPAYRSDILHQMDLAEEVAIAYGYENFEPIIPDVMTIAEEDKFEVFKSRVVNILIGLGLLEISTYHLSNKEINDEKMLTESNSVELENSKTADRSILRSFLTPCLINVLSENTNKEYPQELFEIGVAFRKGKSETGVIEDTKLSVVITHATSDFTSIKQVLDALISSLSKSYSLEKGKETFLITGRQGRVFCEKEEIGFIGEVHPQVLENFKIQVPASCMEIDIGKLYELVIKK